MRRQSNESGFALLLIFVLAAGIAIAMMTQIPRVCFETQRDREETLIDRGEQYKRAIGMYVKKFGRYPGKLEDLDNTNNIRFLRKRYIDPMTGKDEWRIVHAGPGGTLTDSLVQKAPGVGPDGKPLQAGANGQNGFGSSGGFGMNSTGMNQASGMNSNPGNTNTGSSTTGNPNDPNAPPEINAAVKSRPSDRPIGAPGAGGIYDPNQQAQVGYPQAAQQFPGQQQFQGQQQYQGPQQQFPGQQQQQFPGQNAAAVQSGQPIYPGQPGYPQPGQPGYTGTPIYPGQAGYPQQSANQGQVLPNAQLAANQPVYPGQPGYPQPGQPGYTGQPIYPGQAGYPQTAPVDPTQAMIAANPSQYIYQNQTMFQNQGSTGAMPPFPGQTAQPIPGALPGQQGVYRQPGLPQTQQGNFAPISGPNGPVSSAFQANGGGFGNTQNPNGQGTAAGMIQQLLTQPRDAPTSSFGGMNQNQNQALGAGIAGVATKYKGPSIKVYEDRQKYQEWEFVYDPRKEALKKMGAAGQQGQTVNPGNRPSDSSFGQQSGSGQQSGFGQSGFGQQSGQPGSPAPSSGFGRNP